MRKIRFLNWAYEILTEAVELESNIPLIEDSSSDEELENKVRESLEKLEPEQKLLVELFYFQGKSYRQMERVLKLNNKKLEYLHQRTVADLKFLLSDYVQKRFKIKGDIVPNTCVICEHPKRKEIEKIIDSKKESQTWKRVLKKLKQKFDLEIKAPQALMGHKRHCKQRQEVSGVAPDTTLK